jgi:ArsR family transcriptional regulator
MVLEYSNHPATGPLCAGPGRNTLCGAANISVSLEAMNNTDAVSALAALAQDSRLAIFRLLVQNAPDGLTVGVIAEQLDLPAPTLSFHLKTLVHAGLVSTVQEGRFVRAMPRWGVDG